MAQLKARQIQSELNPVTSFCCKAIWTELLTPEMVKSRIKWCKKRREQDGLDEAGAGTSCGEQFFFDCVHGQGKYYFHFVDLGRKPEINESKAWDAPCGKVELPSPLLEVVKDFNFPFLMDYCASFAGWLPTKREVEAICRRVSLVALRAYCCVSYIT